MTKPDKVRPIPEGMHTITPYLTVSGGADAIDFYTRAFGATELYRNTCRQTGRVVHAKLRIGDSVVMLSDAFPEHGGCEAPAPDAASPVTIHLYVEDVDEVFDRAIKSGAYATMPVADTFWGDRYGQLRDPFGHSWSIATHVEDLTPDEIAERAAQAFADTG